VCWGTDCLSCAGLRAVFCWSVIVICLRFSGCFYRIYIYITCYPLPSLIEGSDSNILRASVGPEFDLPNGRRRAPGKILCSAPKLALVSGSRACFFHRHSRICFCYGLLRGWNFDLGCSWSVVMLHGTICVWGLPFHGWGTASSVPGDGTGLQWRCYSVKAKTCRPRQAERYRFDRWE